MTLCASCGEDTRRTTLRPWTFPEWERAGFHLPMCAPCAEALSPLRFKVLGLLQRSWAAKVESAR